MSVPFVRWAYGEPPLPECQAIFPPEAKKLCAPSDRYVKADNQRLDFNRGFALSIRHQQRLLLWIIALRPQFQPFLPRFTRFTLVSTGEPRRRSTQTRSSTLVRFPPLRCRRRR